MVREKDEKLQSHGRFDPFADRTARDIRNLLSEAFTANPEMLLNKLKAIDPNPPQLDMTSFRG